MSELYNENVKKFTVYNYRVQQSRKRATGFVENVTKSQKEYNSSAVESATVNKLNKEELQA